MTVPERGSCYVYDAWENKCYTIETQECPQGTELFVTLEPEKSLIVLFDKAEEGVLGRPLVCAGEGMEITRWKRRNPDR